MSQSKRTMLYCEPCGFKQIIEVQTTPDLFEIKRTDLQSNIPKLEGDKTVNKPVIPRSRMYKCPCCGRGVVVRGLLDAYVKTFAKIDEQSEKARQEEEKQKRIEDGKPHEKVDEPEFLG